MPLFHAGRRPSQWADTCESSFLCGTRPNGSRSKDGHHQSCFSFHVFLLLLWLAVFFLNHPSCFVGQCVKSRWFVMAPSHQKREISLARFISSSHLALMKVYSLHHDAHGSRVPVRITTFSHPSSPSVRPSVRLCADVYQVSVWQDKRSTAHSMSIPQDPT